MQLKNILYFLSLLSLSVGCRAEQLEEVVMYEITSKPYIFSSKIVDIGGPVGEIKITLERNNNNNQLSSLVIEYGELTIATVPSSLLNCVPNPVIEAPIFYYTELDSRDVMPNDWFSSVTIPFSENDSESANSRNDAIIIPLYPSIEFEFLNLTLNRIKLRKSADDIQTTKVIKGKCPEMLIKWASGNN